MHLLYAMKRIVSILALSVLLAWGMQAQERVEINMYIGGYNGEYLKVKETAAEGMTLSSLYEPKYRITTGPVFTLDSHFKINRIVRVGLQLDACPMRASSYTRITGNTEEFKKTLFYILPQAKICIPSPRHFRMYGKVAAGIQVNSILEEGHPVKFAWEVIPFGCQWGGQRVYGTAEICYGSVVRGARIGMGFSF